jgi:hypothetical protein
MKNAMIVVVLLCSSLGAAQTNSTTGAAQQTTGPAPAAASGQSLDPKTEADIRALLKLTGADQLADQMMNSTLTSLRPLLMSSLPAGEYREKLIELFFAKFQAKAPGAQIVELAVPIYASHFSDDEVKQLMAFYETPVGKKSLQVMPQLMTELQAAGQKWGGDLGQECFREVIAEHPEMKTAIEQASPTQK